MGKRVERINHAWMVADAYHLGSGNNEVRPTKVPAEAGHHSCVAFGSISGIAALHDARLFLKVVESRHLER
jgi:hypothetical protein